LLVPVLSALAGLLVSFRMRRLPELPPSASIEGMDLG
jgi:hypothetical protein